MREKLRKLNTIQNFINANLTIEDIKGFNGSLIPLNLFFTLSNSNHFIFCKQVSDGIFTHNTLGSLYVQKMKVLLADNTELAIFIYMDAKNCLAGCQKSAIGVNLYDLEVVVKNAKIIGIDKIMIQENLPRYDETNDIFKSEVVFSDFDFNSEDEIYRCADIIRNFTVR